VIRIPSLSTIDPIDRVDAALAALTDIPLAMAGSIVGRQSEDDDVLRLTTMGPLGRAVVVRIDDHHRYRSTISMICDRHPPVVASMPLSFGSLPKPGRCVAAELGEFALKARDAMSGAAWREPGTEPPYDPDGIAKAFAMLRAAIESQGLATQDGGLMIIRPAPRERDVWIEWRSDGDDGSWEANGAFQAMMAPFCLKSDEISVCGTDENLGKAPLSTHAGHIIQLNRPEQMGAVFRMDPVATLRTGGRIGKGPWLTQGMPF